jgi:hypothetical protein
MTTRNPCLVLADIYAMNDLMPEARSIRSTVGWETRRNNIAERIATQEEIEAYENRVEEFEPDQDDVPDECWDESNNPN